MLTWSSPPIVSYPALTTDDKCTHHATLATCYHLAKSALKISFALAKKVGYGEVGGFLARAAMHMAAVLAGCRQKSLGQQRLDQFSHF